MLQGSHSCRHHAVTRWLSLCLSWRIFFYPYSAMNVCKSLDEAGVDIWMDYREVALFSRVTGQVDTTIWGCSYSDSVYETAHCRVCWCVMGQVMSVRCFWCWGRVAGGPVASVDLSLVPSDRLSGKQGCGAPDHSHLVSEGQWAATPT